MGEMHNTKTHRKILESMVTCQSEIERINARSNLFVMGQDGNLVGKTLGGGRLHKLLFNWTTTITVLWGLKIKIVLRDRGYTHHSM